MLDEQAQWPSGIRDTTEFPKVNITIDTSFREHLAAFLKLDGIGWNDYDAQREISDQTVANSRMRTNRKMYERMGVIYRDDDKIRLSHLGLQMKNLESDLIEAKERILSHIRLTAIDILSRYQLRNPVDGPELPASCDVLPCVCIWKAMRALDNKISYEEMNRVILHIMEMNQLDEAIQIIRNARARYDTYSVLDEATLNSVLGNPVHTDQPTARIAPWFSFAGWGGLVIKQNVDNNGFRYLVEETVPQIDAILDKPYPYFETDDKDAWLRYYIGSAAEVSAEVNTVDGIRRNPDETIRLEHLTTVNFHTGYRSPFAHNRILFGAPGTGKSYTLNHEKDELLADGGEYERVTFHPDYSYANFVGTYKPVPHKDTDGKDAITYSYVPGPFMRTYVKALQNSKTGTPKPFLLVIEEINRANVAAVFGDVFQLLDRGDNEVSEYPIQATEDIKKYLASPDVLGGSPEDYAEIRIPDNMFIWATMNSADQGVFPMDTAFKRRWDFTYLGIDDSETGIIGKKVILGQGEYRRIVEWNELRKAINAELITYKVNEDKLMGPYFISKKNLPEGEMFDPASFTRIFKNKVLMYLFDDAAKQKRPSLFAGCEEGSRTQYSKICREFDTKGVSIFCEGIRNKFIDVPGDDAE